MRKRGSIQDGKTQKWYERLEKMKKEVEKGQTEERHQQKVHMISSAEGSAGLLHKNHQACSMERRSTDLDERTDVK